MVDFGLELGFGNKLSTVVLYLQPFIWQPPEVTMAAEKKVMYDWYLHL